MDRFGTSSSEKAAQGLFLPSAHRSGGVTDWADDRDPTHPGPRKSWEKERGAAAYHDFAPRPPELPDASALPAVFIFLVHILVRDGSCK
jgi:hypothetical protein